MRLRLRHSRIITPAAITVPDSTAQYSTMRGSMTASRVVTKGEHHQGAMALSLDQPGQHAGRAFQLNRR
jgi:hypothetical protein